jgi:uncharacterized protein (DUF1778 family)
MSSTQKTATGHSLDEECDLIDRLIIELEPQAFAQFLARLDMPPQPNDRLRRTMQTPAPWDKV